MTPTRLGPYRLLQPIATRALTVTYRAEHVELSRPALVKALKPTVPVSSPFAQELEREAVILARIRHESIPEVLDFQRTAETMWLAIEDPGGHRLDEIIRIAGQLDVDVATAITLELARGLGHAHERGVVHRDLRPSSIELTPRGCVKIMDFAAAHDDRTPSIPEPFEVSSVTGSADYMAPELILGEDGRPPADVFALGVLLYELTTGAHPFAAEKTAGAARSSSRDLSQRIRSTSARPLRDALPDAPRALERIVARCLAREPGDRYANGREVAAALEEELASHSRVPTRVLVSRALAQAKLGSEIRGPGSPVVVAPRENASGLGTLAAFGAIFALVVAGGAVIELGVRGDEAGDARAAAPENASMIGRGYLRVLARPWAEVILDGELVDTTPIGRPIPLTPGTHYVTFKHPNAPEEKRTVKVLAGQTVLLDVTMNVDRLPPRSPPPDPDAAPPTP